uniref:Very-long-chain (3R)-3-hydroxyacyl-CoA dehydratase n=1 Tax=Hordeum vulgare subsp. vulgare TaxID=112509 RepID=F2DWF8_HORVV|nr:predicted protein [Hordeum vulgare subsp. vulgare]
MSTKTSNKQSGLATAYLIFYNVVLTLGWAFILVLTIQTALKWKTPKTDILTAKSIYPTVEFYLLVFQTAAILEVVHAAVGLVRSNPILTLFQVLSRLIVVWLVCYPFKDAKNSLGFSLVCIAWPIAEIVRYSYYAFNLINFVPSFITWCRYTFFIILYPLGVTGELICIYRAFEYVAPLNIRKQYSYFLPNKYNVSFDAYYSFFIVMLLYIPIFPKLYGHMLVQRKKIVGGGAKSEAKKTQ